MHYGQKTVFVLRGLKKHTNSPKTHSESHTTGGERSGLQRCKESLTNALLHVSRRVDHYTFHHNTFIGCIREKTRGARNPYTVHTVTCECDDGADRAS